MVCFQRRGVFGLGTYLLRLFLSTASMSCLELKLPLKCIMLSFTTNVPKSTFETRVCSNRSRTGRYRVIFAYRFSSTKCAFRDTVPSQICHSVSQTQADSALSRRRIARRVFGQESTHADPNYNSRVWNDASLALRFQNL